MAAPKVLTAMDTSHAVDTFLATLVHPQKPLVEAVRAEILACHPTISEGIKWNAPSYRTAEYFATTNLREKDGVGLILHLGAKVRADAMPGDAISDPKGTLKWLAKDRAMLVFRDESQLRRDRAAFRAIVKSWIKWVS